MIWLKEIEAVGLRDWLWFVFKLRRNEFHSSLDMLNWRGTPLELIRARGRAHNIDDVLTHVHLNKKTWRSDMIMYMCATDFQHEMGTVAVKMYPDIESLKRDMPCVEECGIVSVRVELEKWVDPGIPYAQRGNNRKDKK